MKRRVMVYLDDEQFIQLAQYVRKTKRTKTGTLEIALERFFQSEQNESTSADTSKC